MRWEIGSNDKFYHESSFKTLPALPDQPEKLCQYASLSVLRLCQTFYLVMLTLCKLCHRLKPLGGMAA